MLQSHVGKYSKKNKDNTNGNENNQNSTVRPMVGSNVPLSCLIYFIL